MTQINKIAYFNGFGNGDLHYSREFVKFFVSKLPIESTYTHVRCPFLLRDLSVRYERRLSTTSSDPNQMGFYIEDSTLFFGTWIGQNRGKWLNADGCTIKNNYNMYAHFASLFGIDLLQEVEYIPSIDYSKYDIDDIKLSKDKNILICNGPCISGQTRNFDMNPIIIALAQKHPSCRFFITKPFASDLTNIIDTNSFISDKTKSDLNEISYISTFCDIIVGRGSGPFCFTHVKDNLFNKNKTYISFGNIQREINWVTMSDYQLPEHAVQIWSDSGIGCEDRAFVMIDEEINAKFGNR
jgi:hypothetical protein